jgi:flagellar hook-basal body complex protein FliE
VSSISAIGGNYTGAGGVAEIMAMRAQIIQKSQLLQQVHASQGATTTSGVSSSGGAGSFTQALTNALGSVNATQTRAETLSADYEQGKTQDVAKVMLARQEAQVGFEATLQVRNKLMSAYQDIMKLGV